MTSPLPLGRADAKATDMVTGAGSARDHRGSFSGCAPRPEVLILRSRWGAGGAGGAAPWARPPLRRHATPGPAAPLHRATPAPQEQPRAAPPSGRPAPRARPAAAAPPPASGRRWFGLAPPRRAHVRPTPPDAPTPPYASGAIGGAGDGRARGAGAAAS